MDTSLLPQLGVTPNMMKSLDVLWDKDVADGVIYVLSTPPNVDVRLFENNYATFMILMNSNVENTLLHAAIDVSSLKSFLRIEYVNVKNLFAHCNLSSYNVKREGSYESHLCITRRSELIHFYKYKYKSIKYNSTSIIDQRL